MESHLNCYEVPLSPASAVLGGPSCEAEVFLDNLQLGVGLLLAGEDGEGFVGDGVFKDDFLFEGGVEAGAVGLHAGFFLGEASSASMRAAIESQWP